MSAVCIKIVKSHEDEEWAEYIIGDPPRRLLGHVRISKSDGKIEVIDIEERYKRLLHYVEKLLTELFEKGEYPEEAYYCA